MTSEELLSIQAGRQYKKIYNNFIDNYIMSKQNIKAINKKILQERVENQELEKDIKEAIEDTLKDLCY